MKLSKYAGIVKKDKICLVDTLENGEIWLGSGVALYKAEGLPGMSGKEQIRMVLDIEKKKMESIHLKEMQYTDRCNVNGFNLCDVCEGEVAAEHMKIAAVQDGVRMACLKCRDGELVFYNDRHLEPLSDMIKEGYLNMFVRTMVNGNKYIAVKDEFILVAVIMPMKVVNDDYLDDLHEFLVACSEQNERQKAREAAAEQRGDRQ